LKIDLSAPIYATENGAPPSASLLPQPADIQEFSTFLLEMPGSGASAAPQVIVASMNMVDEELSSLKEHGDCHDACSDGCMDSFEADREARRISDPKTRKCLLCRDPFPSAWAGERVCKKCKSTSTWRSSGME
jgi:hypothetical protein